ncbi:Contactin-associated protein-like 2 [Acropora cervicornis]|uniref:Contactin-associated protein-like 2 n=1 Tax=Acropora cervicornis TaxID=6130 RepID=A0AAD9PPT5_ACRCE|nr:Contactin-associated protein-like 2 [Acropora cervicornis]
MNLTGFSKPPSFLIPAKSCSEIKYKSPQATSDSYTIDPDEERSHGPFTAFCDMTGKNGVGMTVISHDSEATMHVTGYEPRGNYVRNVHYIATGLTNVPQLASLTDVSTHCEQFIKYECRGSKLFNGNHGLWVSRTRAKMTYWGGATPADHKNGHPELLRLTHAQTQLMGVIAIKITKMSCARAAVF